MCVSIVKSLTGIATKTKVSTNFQAFIQLHLYLAHIDKGHEGLNAKLLTNHMKSTK